MYVSVDLLSFAVGYIGGGVILCFAFWAYSKWRH